MTISTLSDELRKELLPADEIWIAVALLNSDGLRFIRENIKEDCREHYVIGIDLPSHPDALTALYNLRYTTGFQARVFTQPIYFHPKMYLVRRKKNFVAFIGSANCTRGGLERNVELTVRVDDQGSCKGIKDWFDSQYAVSNPITREFLQEYRASYSVRLRQKQEERLNLKKQKEHLLQGASIHIRHRKRLIASLRLCKRLPAHNGVVGERRESVKELRRLLDYPKFRPEKIKVDEFFAIPALGHIIAIPKPTIKREIVKFSDQLKLLCDESVDLSERYNRAMRGDMEIRGVKEGLISKILTVHNPDEYFVLNSKILTVLKKYGFEFPSGLTAGDKYRITSETMQAVCRDAGLENMAVLDYYLYTENE